MRRRGEVRTQTTPADAEVVADLVDRAELAGLDDVTTALTASGWRRERVVLAADQAVRHGLLYRDCRGGLQRTPVAVDGAT